VSHSQIDHALSKALAQVSSADQPPRLAAAVRHAVFPGGARIRPKLTLAVAAACGDSEPALSLAAACAVEFLHCASLVHDDLPCFDNAATRRGQASVHAAYGERLAVLAGDALIVLAFQTLARAGAQAPQRLAPVLATVAAAVGLPHGIAAGQAWECEPKVCLADYQRAKTGVLFSAAAAAGAQAAGSAPQAWAAMGARLGEAYQVADDIRDVAADPHALGKPIGVDEALGRPSMAAELGLEGAVHHFDGLVQKAMSAVPECPGARALRALLRAEARRLVPVELSGEISRLAA
jgi:geranylgeranyl diphosphate synthase, type II